MCGRLACGLQPHEVRNSCSYKPPGGSNSTKPEWINCQNLGKTYKPSYNICPTDVAPVLLSGTHFKSNSRVIAPMIFGVIPHWSQPNEKSKYSTTACRIETVQTSKLYRQLLQKGQRCVVVCNGYFEWQSRPEGKMPYFVHPQQPEGVEIDDPNSWNLHSAEEKSLKLLKLAALFEMDPSKPVEERTLSFTIITKEASCQISWLHKRMPAILETSGQVDAWLNFEEVDADRALQCLSHEVSITCVPVSRSVNSVTNKDISCIKEEKVSKQQEKNLGSASLLKSWLQRGQKRKSDENTENIEEKIKKEEA